MGEIGNGRTERQNEKVEIYKHKWKAGVFGRMHDESGEKNIESEAEHDRTKDLYKREISQHNLPSLWKSMRDN